MESPRKECIEGAGNAGADDAGCSYRPHYTTRRAHENRNMVMASPPAVVATVGNLPSPDPATFLSFAQISADE